MSVTYHGHNFLSRTLTAQSHEPIKGVIDLRTRFQLVEAGKLFIAIKHLVDIASHTIPTVVVAGRCWTTSHGDSKLQDYLVKTWCRNARILIPVLTPEIQLVNTKNSNFRFQGNGNLTPSIVLVNIHSFTREYHTRVHIHTNSLLLQIIRIDPFTCVSHF